MEFWYEMRTYGVKELEPFDKAICVKQITCRNYRSTICSFYWARRSFYSAKNRTHNLFISLTCDWFARYESVRQT